MSASPTGFVWYELMATDGAAAADYYAAVVGWTAMANGGGDHPGYTILSAGDRQIAGAMSMPAHMRAQNIPPHWGGYIGVANTDAMAARVVAAGGALCHGPEDIPGVGRFAVMADPQGAVFTLFTHAMVQSPAIGHDMTPGHVGWHELSTSDAAAAFDWYAALFGWTKGTPMDMGPMGIYQLFGAGSGDFGGMMRRPDPSMHPAWLFYFNVADIDAAIARATGHGGRVLNGPMEVPGGAWVAQCMDPQGAVFAMVGMRAAA